MTEQMTENYIVIKECKERVLSHEEWSATDDYGLFHFTHSRVMRDRAIFADCTFANLFIAHKSDWGAPIPSTFQRFFEDIVRLLVPNRHQLVLNVVDLYEGYFDPADLIQRILKPEKRTYFFLEKEIGGKKYSTLFFECPLKYMKAITDNAFSTSLIDVDGFVMTEANVEPFEKWISAGNTDLMFRQLIRDVDLAFAVWGDHNGLFIVTDKLDISELGKLFCLSGLEDRVKQYVRSQREEG